MGSDSFFEIGYSHDVCQDYVLSGENYLILSDGCTSAPHTDIGARIITHMTKKYIKYKDFPLKEIMNDSKSLLNDYFSLPLDILSATLLVAKKTNDSFNVFLMGDGVIVAKRKDSKILVELYESPFSAPYYPKYTVDHITHDMYMDKFGSIRKKTSWLLSNDNMDLLSEEIQNCTEPAISMFPQNEYEFVALFSDGLLSFLETIITNTSKSTTIVHWKEILIELLAFKSYTGEFVKRRFKRALKEFESKNWHHFDDLSMGVLA